jgi:O-phosphoseryl-tRNA(Sec) selenium transferase
VNTHALADTVNGWLQVKSVARLCQEFQVPHVINNAYGVQSRELCQRVTAACRAGRVDLVVQSTDKNFLVPVGGAVAAATAARPDVLQRMTGAYPGRASVCSHLDMATTLLYLGRQGWRKVLEEREALFPKLKVRSLTNVSALMSQCSIVGASIQGFCDGSAWEGWSVPQPGINTSLLAPGCGDNSAAN